MQYDPQKIIKINLNDKGRAEVKEMFDLLQDVRKTIQCEDFFKKIQRLDKLAGKYPSPFCRMSNRTDELECLHSRYMDQISKIMISTVKNEGSA